MTIKKTAHSLLRVNMLLMRNLSSHMRQGRLPMSPAHVGILMRISDKPCSISELADHQSVRLPTMSKSISNLVDSGLVERWTPEQNRRQSMVGLTDEGKKVISSIQKEITAYTASLLKNLTAEEIDKLDEVIASLNKVIVSD